MALANAMITQRHVQAKKIWGIPQFWLLWLVPCMNVSAGIGVIGMASPMLREVFGGKLTGIDKRFGELDKAQLAAIAGVAGGFTALLSLFNIGGRFFWASLSDKLGIGLIANLLVKPVADKHFMTDAEPAAEKQLAHERAVASEVGRGKTTDAVSATPAFLVVLAWLAVGIPLVWGVYRRLLTAGRLFQ